MRFRLVINDLQFSILSHEFVYQENIDIQKIINNLKIVLISKNYRKIIEDIEHSIENDNISNVKDYKNLFIRFCSEIEFVDDRSLENKEYSNFFTSDISVNSELNNIANLSSYSKNAFSTTHSVKTYENTKDSWKNSDFILKKTSNKEVLIYDKYYRQNIERSIEFTSEITNLIKNNDCDIIVLSGQHEKFLDRRSEYINFENSDTIKKYNNKKQRISIIIQTRLTNYGNHDRFMFCGQILIKSGPGFDAHNSKKNGFIDFYNLYYKEYSTVFLNSFKEVVKTIDLNEFRDNPAASELLMKYRKTLNIQ